MKLANLLTLLLLAVQASSSLGGEVGGEVVAFTGGHVIPCDGDEIPGGNVIIDGNKIVAVGPASSTPIPEGARKVDCGGRFVMPGLVCTHSHIGGPGAADSSHQVQPGVRVMDSINVRDSGFIRALAGGLTSLNIMPGSGHLTSGQTVYVKLRYYGDGPSTIDDILIRDADGNYMGGLKMANGTNSQGAAPFPGTRGRSAFLMRQEFIKAQEYAAKVIAARKADKDLPPRDLHLESLAEVLSGKRTVHHHTHRHDDIMTVIRLSKEFGFRVVLHHVSEGWKVADEIAAAGIPCSMIMIDSPGGKLEARYLSLETGKVLEQAGVRTAFHTDDPILDSRYFLRSAAIAVRAGMSRGGALQGVTLAAAEMLDLGDRVGSLTVGKEADIIVLDKDPLSVYAKVQQTWVDGQLAFDRSRDKDHLYAVGGYGAGHDQEPYFCCFDQSNQGGAQ